jgi:hypothetical protein
MTVSSGLGRLRGAAASSWVCVTVPPKKGRGVIPIGAPGMVQEWKVVSA